MAIKPDHEIVLTLRNKKMMPTYVTKTMGQKNKEGAWPGVETLHPLQPTNLTIN